MKSLQHVLWRGALALSLMAVGIGSGVGMAPIEQAAIPASCADAHRALVADQAMPPTPIGAGESVIVLRQAFTPAG